MSWGFISALLAVLLPTAFYFYGRRSASEKKDLEQQATEARNELEVRDEMDGIQEDMHRSVPDEFFIDRLLNKTASREESNNGSNGDKGDMQ